MKLVLVVITSVLWIAYLFGATALVVVNAELESAGQLLLFTSGVVVFVVASALILGALVSQVADPSTEAGRRYYRRLMIPAVGLAIAASVLLVIFGVVNAMPAWITTVVIVAGWVVSIVVLAAGERYRRRTSPPRQSDKSWTPINRGRAFRVMALTFVITTVVAVALLVAVFTADGQDDGPIIVQVVVVSLGFGALAASFVALRHVWPLSTRVGEIFGTDLESRKVVWRAVVRGKSEQLDESQQRMASTYASLMRDLVPVQATQSILVLVGVLCVQVPNILNGVLEGIAVWLAVVVAIALVASSIAWSLQLRNVKRYAEAHPQAYSSSASSA